METKNVCVLGKGEFGQGIAEVLTQSGLNVIQREIGNRVAPGRYRAKEKGS